MNYVDEYGKVSHWSVDIVGEMTLYNHEEYENRILNTENMKITKYHNNSAHEFGHLMGLGHSYDGAKNTDEVNIKNDIMGEGPTVTSNDIEMMFMAVLKNKEQHFYGDKSEAIRQAQ